MKQRILSILLAVCMVVAAMPVLLLPIFAAGSREGFVSAFEAGGENWPTDAGQGKVVFNNDWTIGVYHAGAYSTMDQISDSQYLTLGGTQWGDSGIFTFIKTGRSALLGAHPGETPDGSGTGPGAYYSPEYGGNKSALSYTYTAPYEGKVNLGVIGIAATNETAKEPALGEGEIHQAYMAIFVNNVMVWPTAGGSITNPEDFVKYPYMEGEGDEEIKVTEINTEERPVDALNNIDIMVGDVITFVAARYNCRYIKYTPTVEYQDDYKIAPSKLPVTFNEHSLTWLSDKPTNGVGNMKQEDAYWTVGNYDANGTFTPYLVNKRAASECWAAATKDLSDAVKNNGIKISSGEPTANGAYMLGTDDTAMPAYQYTAMATGTANLGVAAGFALLDLNMEPAAAATATVGCFVNGTKVGTITVTSTDGVASVSGTVEGVAICKGDSVVFAVESATGTATVKAMPVVNYTAITSFIGEATSDTYAIAFEDAEIIVADKIGVRFAAYGTVDVYQNSDNGIELRVWDTTVEGEKTAANATDTLSMTLNRTDYSYRCDYDEFAPKQMTDKIFIQAFITVDGEEKVASAITEVCLADLAFAQYNAAVAAEDEKGANLMAAVLNYGAAAQKYFDYNTDNLANKNLPAEAQVIEKKEDGWYRSEGMDYLPSGATNVASSEITSGSLIFESTLSIRLYVDVAPDEVACPVSVRIGTSADNVSEDSGTEVDGANSITLENIGLDNLSTVYYFQTLVRHTRLLANGKTTRVTYYGDIFSYSVESYVARMAYNTENPELGDLLHALMNLGACVEAQ